MECTFFTVDEFVSSHPDYCNIPIIYVQDYYDLSLELYGRFECFATCSTRNLALRLALRHNLQLFEQQCLGLAGVITSVATSFGETVRSSGAFNKSFLGQTNHGAQLYQLFAQRKPPIQYRHSSNRGTGWLS